MATKEDKRREFPATSPEHREQQLINLAYNTVEERIRNNQASSGELVHFLKLGSKIADLNIKQKEAEIELLRQKTKTLEAEQSSAEMIEAAIKAMGLYSGDEQ